MAIIGYPLSRDMILLTSLFIFFVSRTVLIVFNRLHNQSKVYDNIMTDALFL